MVHLRMRTPFGKSTDKSGHIQEINLVRLKVLPFDITYSWRVFHRPPISEDNVSLYFHDVCVVCYFKTNNNCCLVSTVLHASMILMPYDKCPNESCVRQLSGRPWFSLRSCHTKDSKMVLAASWFNTQHHKVRINSKVVQSREWSCALHCTAV